MLFNFSMLFVAKGTLCDIEYSGIELCVYTFRFNLYTGKNVII